MDKPRWKRNRIAWVMLCAGIAGTIAFAWAIAAKLMDRERDAAYYESLSGFFVSEPVISEDDIPLDAEK